MPFDPAFPQANSPLVSAEYRNQFNSLKDLIDQLPTAAQVQAAIAAGSVPRVTIATIDTPVHPTPTFEDVVALQQKVNEIALAMRP